MACPAGLFKIAGLVRENPASLAAGPSTAPRSAQDDGFWARKVLETAD
jgi:hypothetical protein